MVLGLAGVEGLEGVVGLEPPEPCEEEPDPGVALELEEPLALVEAALVLVAVLAVFVLGSGKRGERVVRRSLTLLGAAGGRLRDRLFGARLADRHARGGEWRAPSTRAAAGVAVVEPPPSTAYATAATSASATSDDERQQAPVEQVGLDGVHEVAHGLTLTTAGDVGELDAAVLEAGLAAAPVGALVAPVSPWLAGST